jgi:hypothetical protein
MAAPTTITFTVKAGDGSVLLEKTQEINLKDEKFETLESELVRFRKEAFEEITPALLSAQQSAFIESKKKS